MTNPLWSKRMREDTETIDDEQETLVQDEWAEPVDELPPRPKRKLVTPVTATLAGVLLVAAGFFGGVQVQKSQGSSGGATPSGFPGMRAAAGGAGTAGSQTGGGAQTDGRSTGGGAAGATIGTVSSTDGDTLYVKGTSGTTVKVKAGDDAKVTRTATASVGAIHPGDTVIVQGTTKSSGTVVASSITATQSGAQGGFGAMMGAGGPPSGAGFGGGMRAGAGVGGYGGVRGG